ncbi:MAG: outer membrane protein assembly factor BamD, partial [Polyangiaceae bacterium]|nr:outer membrane protein assembly factor BamD [Polyangiaceae bacterium]
AAREALAGGRARAALAALDAYSARFPGGRLALEAEVLRIEALAGSGEASAATALARAFLAAHPASPYANRLRPIAERGGAGTIP